MRVGGGDGFNVDDSKGVGVGESVTDNDNMVDTGGIDAS